MIQTSWEGLRGTAAGAPYDELHREHLAPGLGRRGGLLQAFEEHGGSDAESGGIGRGSGQLADLGEVQRAPGINVGVGADRMLTDEQMLAEQTMLAMTTRNYRSV